MSESLNLMRGSLDVLILGALADGPLHGYAIAKRVEHSSGDVLRVEEGSLYPALYRMAKRGLVESEWGRSENNRRARFYQLTDRGRQHLENEAAAWGRFSEAMSRALRPWLGRGRA